MYRTLQDICLAIGVVVLSKYLPVITIGGIAGIVELVDRLKRRRNPPTLEDSARAMQVFIASLESSRWGRGATTQRLNEVTRGT